ncbi:hypothetical protein V8F20_006006, partial [Naviculisporaceae sp. PSN 640]
TSSPIILAIFVSLTAFIRLTTVYRAFSDYRAFNYRAFHRAQQLQGITTTAHTTAHTTRNKNLQSSPISNL